MTDNVKLKTVTLLVFCTYLFWDFFGLDITMSHGSERFPLHRLFIGMTVLLFIANFKPVLVLLQKNKLLIILIFYVLLTGLWSYDSKETLKTFIFLLSVLFISTLTALSFNQTKLKLMQYLFWLLFILVIASIVTAHRYPQYGINTIDFGRARWIGITDHPNKLGALSLSLVWIAISLFYLSNRLYEKIFAVFGIIVAFYTLFRADSMTSIFASLFVLAYTTYSYFIGSKSLTVKLAFLCLAVFLSLAVTTFYMSSTEIINTTLKSSGRNTTLTGRSKLWANAYVSIENNLLLGSGFDELEQLSKKHHMTMSHLHNGYIELMVKGGIIAGILFISILFKTLLRQLLFIKINPQSFIFLNAGLIGILIHNLAESSILRDLNSLNILLLFIIVSTSQTAITKKSTTRSF